MWSLRVKGQGHRVAFAGVVVGLAVLLGACTSPSTPTDLGAAKGSMSTVGAVAGASRMAPSPATSTTGSRTDSAGLQAYPSTVPAAARANTTEGAKAFIAYYYGLMNEAFMVPRAGLLSPLSAATCKTCEVYESTAEQYVARGHRYDGPTVSVREISPNWQDANDHRKFDVTIHQNQTRVLDASGKVVGSNSADDGVLVVSLSWSSGGWKFDLVQLLT